MAMTPRYMQMIDKLHEALSQSIWTKPADNWRVDPWASFLLANPSAMDVANAVGKIEKYELSWNQCCNAVARLMTAQPESC